MSLRICLITIGARQPGVSSIHWFRKDLRLHDNPSLIASIKNCSSFFPVYILDMEACRRSRISANRWNFLCECLHDLDTQLRSIGSRLYVVRGRAMEALPRLFWEWKATRLTFESDNEPAGRQRDAAVEGVAAKLGVEVIRHNSHLLYDIDDVKDANDGEIPLEQEKFLASLESMNRPSIPEKPLDKSSLRACVTWQPQKEHSSMYDVPNLTEFGVKDERLAPARRYWKGGEKEGLRRLGLFLRKVS